MKKFRFLFAVLALAALMTVASFATDVSARDLTFENELAADLKSLGLFSGVSENNFDLERVPTRTEVLVMLIRVLGEEQTALDGDYEHPFTDVPAWADPYVGYAYENGLTKGTSPTKFGTDNASAVTYLTFMLRALGYSDVDGDFAWDNPFDLAKGLGLLPSIVDTDNFLRADIVTVSYAALSVNLKDSTVMLAEKLIEKGAFTSETYGANYRGTKLTDKENEGKTALTAEQIFSECSSAVVYINTYDEDGEPDWNGSGFFIDESGIGVTTYYTLEGAARAEVVLPATGQKYDITGIFDSSGRYDWVVFKVDGEGFDTLRLSPLPVNGASTVYAIGSPAGLENTVSEGIVSNARRVYGEFAYIQTTAAISSGSFGGPLVNKYGEAIGIIHDYEYGAQNINFALPVSAIAAADKTSATPFAEYDWNSVWYYADTDEVTVKVGEAVEYEFDYDYCTVDYEAPALRVSSSDNTVATATLGVNYGTLRITGNKAGTVEVVIYDDISKDTHTVTVTVEENPDITAPAVSYNSAFDEVKMWKGATKIFVVDIVEYGITDTPDGTLAAEYSVKSSNSKIKVEYEFAQPDDLEKYPEFEGKYLPYLGIKVACDKDAAGEITVSNNKTGDTLVIPVTVGNRYESAYKELVDGIIGYEETVHVTDEENPENECYSIASSGYAMLYYPASGNVVFNMQYSEAQLYTTLSFSFTWTKDEITKYEISMSIMGITMSCAGDIESPETFGQNIENFKHDTYECPEIYKASFEEEVLPQMTGMLLSMVYALDEGLLPEICPTLDMSDFGFIYIDKAMEEYYAN